MNTSNTVFESQDLMSVGYYCSLLWILPYRNILFKSGGGRIRFIALFAFFIEFFLRLGPERTIHIVNETGIRKALSDGLSG